MPRAQGCAGAAMYTTHECRICRKAQDVRERRCTRHMSVGYAVKHRMCESGYVQDVLYAAGAWMSRSDEFCTPLH